MFDDWWMSMHFIDCCAFSFWCLIIVAFLMVVIVWNNHCFDDWWCLIFCARWYALRRCPHSSSQRWSLMIEDCWRATIPFVWWLTVAVYFACSMVSWMQPSVPLLTTQASQTMFSRACSVRQAQSIPRNLPSRADHDLGDHLVPHLPRWERLCRICILVRSDPRNVC